MIGAGEAMGGMVESSAGLRWRQLWAVTAFELRQRFRGMRAIPLLLLAAAPAALLLMAGILGRIFAEPGDLPAVEQTLRAYAEVFHTLFLRFCVFFGSGATFLLLYRGDAFAKSLHYYLLAPVRRELVTAGKFLAGLLACGLVFSGSAILSWFFIYIPAKGGFGALPAHMFQGPGLRLLATYVGITWLACLGYGALFLFIGQRFKNPIAPTMIVLAWEGLHPFLPPILKKLSVTHYLGSLAPVPVEVPLISLVAEPATPAVATAGLLIFTAVVLLITGRDARKLEIDYGSE